MPAAPMSIEPPPPELVLSVGEELSDGDGGRFVILGLLGKGGMGEVYRAEWWKRGAKTCVLVAIKVMLAKNADDPKAMVRFGAESKALREIHDPNVVQVLAAGLRKRDRLAWMAMELLRGKTLQEILEQQGKLPIPWALAIIRDACSGFQAVHSIAIHRDIKPQNLFLCIDGVIKILDLGASKFLDKELVMHTTTGFQVGTWPYMSPEQIRNQVLDERSDLFSLTVVLYQMLTGRHPFDFGGGLPGWFETCSRIIDKPHAPPDHVAPWLPRYVVEILNKGLAKDPSKRFRSAKEMEEVLTAALNQLAADKDLEPLTTFAATLAPHEEAPLTPPPVDAQHHSEQDVGQSDGATRPRAATPLPYAVTDKVPEAPDDGFSTWSRRAMLPPEVEASRVSRIATKRPELLGSPASAPAAAPAPPPTASNDVAAADPEEEFILEMARQLADGHDAACAPVPAAAADPKEDDVAPDKDQDLCIELSDGRIYFLEPLEHTEAELELTEAAAAELSADDAAKVLLADAIRRLPDELRLPFVWNQAKKMSIDEIVERTGVPAETVHERLMVAHAAIRAEIRRRLSDGHDAAGTPAPVEQTKKVGASEQVLAIGPSATPELGPKGTVKMIESAATILAKQGKTLEQAQEEARAATRSEAYDRPTPHPNSLQQGRGIVLAVALVIALIGGSAAALFLRGRAVEASALPAASTAPTSTAPAATATTTAAPTASTTAAPSASTTAAPLASTAVPTVAVPRGAPKRLQIPRGSHEPRADAGGDPFKRQPNTRDEEPRTSGRLFGVER